MSSFSVQIASWETKNTLFQRQTGIISAFFSQTPILAAFSKVMYSIPGVMTVLTQLHF